MMVSARNSSYERRELLREILQTAIAAGLAMGLGLVVLAFYGSFFWRDDYQAQYLATYFDIGRAWSNGEWPLVSDSSWLGGALAGEYQYGTFSLFHNVLCVAVWKLGLSLPAAAAALAIPHLGILAAGGFRLARGRGIRAEFAMMVALAVSLNGWCVTWSAARWLPSLSSLTWVPWFWWALERATKAEGQQVVAGQWRFVPAGLFLYLTLTAGWPYGDLIVALLTLWLLLKVLVRHRSIKKLFPIIAAWTFALALSAPAFLMFFEVGQETGRSLIGHGRAYNYFVPLNSLFGLIIPTVASFWIKFGKLAIESSMAMACGVVPVVAIVAAVSRYGRSFLRERRWLSALLVVSLVFAVSPGWGSFGWSIRWLGLVHLALGLLAAHALERLEDCQGGHVYLAKIGVVVVVLAWAREWSLGLSRTSVGSGLLAIAVLWMVLARLLRRKQQVLRWMPAVVVFVSLAFTYVRGYSEIKGIQWRISERVRQHAPLDRERRYLSVYLKEDVYSKKAATRPDYGTLLRPGNLPMYSGQQFISGYSATVAKGLEALFGFDFHGCVRKRRAHRTIAMETGPEGLLQLMGVDGIVLSQRLRELGPLLDAQGWTASSRNEAATVYHRNGPRSSRVRVITSAVFQPAKSTARRILTRNAQRVPFVLLSDDEGAIGRTGRFGPASVKLIEETRDRTVVDVRPETPDAPTLVVFSRAWYPGYKARLDDKELVVRRLNLILPAVEVPSGNRGRLVLAYEPDSFSTGMLIALTTVGLLFLGWLATIFLNRKK